jgi:hypothetical protein
VFRMNVAKVDQDVAYVAIGVHLCCKHLSPMFHLFFRYLLQVCFIWMLHMVHTYIASVLFGCCVCFAMATDVFSWCFQMYVTSVSIVSDVCCSGLHLKQLLGPLACAWVWRERHGAV